MVVLHRIALSVLWVLAAVGIACGLVWGATAAGFIKPLIVISGSMEPHIQVGDLVVDTPVDSKTLEVGDVVSLPSTLTHDLVTHRIVSVAPSGDGYAITLKGDNNRFADALEYHVGAQVWAPKALLPGAGTVVERLMSPAVLLALLVSVLAVVGLAWMTPASRRDDDTASADGDDTAPADARRLDAPHPAPRALAGSAIR